MTRAADVALMADQLLQAVRPTLVLQVAAQLLAADVRFDGGLSGQTDYPEELCRRSLRYARMLVKLADEVPA